MNLSEAQIRMLQQCAGIVWMSMALCSSVHADESEVHVSTAVRDADGFLVHTIQSPYQAGETELLVLLPDRIDPARRYPVLFVLPVEAGRGERWGDGILEVRRADLHNRHGLICVMPTFSQLPWYCDHPTDPEIRQETYLLEVILPLLESEYPMARHDREGRLLVGFSKSGWGAWSLLLRHPDRFGRAAAWDAPLMLDAPGQYGSGPIFGTEENFERYRIANLLTQQADLLRRVAGVGATSGSENLENAANASSGASSAALRPAPATQRRPRLIHLGYGNFRDDHVAIESLLTDLEIPRVYHDGPQLAHHWNSGWLPQAVRLLVATDSTRSWRLSRELPAAEAHQAAAADGDFVYAISNSLVAKYDRQTGERVAISTGAARHLNSGFFHEGRLYCAHSNYPQIPELSEIKVLDVDSMELSTFQDFGNFGGSLTWAVRHDGAWWCNFARYGDENHETFLVRFDDEWRETDRWQYPPEVIARLGNYSLSGGLWLDDHLLVTGHDDRVLFRLQLPDAGSVLHFVDAEPAPFTGQGIALDPRTGGLVGIDRARRQILFASPCDGTDFHAVSCEGTYPKHLQGVCTNDCDALFWSFTDVLVKTDINGRVLKQIPVADHHGDLCYFDGRVYVAVNLGQFNQPTGKADSWVYVYDAGTLEELSRHETQEVVRGAGGIACDGERFIVVGGLPEEIDDNYLYEYNLAFEFQQRHLLESGHTHLGIQTAAFFDDTWWFGCYGEPKLLLTADAEFGFLDRYEFDCSLGITGLPDGRILVGQGSCSAGACAGEIVEAVSDDVAGLVIRRERK